jgi:hypothetical protein
MYSILVYFKYTLFTGSRCQRVHYSLYTVHMFHASMWLQTFIMIAHTFCQNITRTHLQYENYIIKIKAPPSRSIICTHELDHVYSK